MECFFEKFLSVILLLASNKQLDSEQIKVLEEKLKKVYVGLKTCGKKMTSASKFIDFFVHDILDYTILNKEEAKF